ncbi:hypothetical protein RSAG8_12927, partial [Rhizoctonia solani AG-8 WAC10335]
MYMERPEAPRWAHLEGGLPSSLSLPPSRSPPPYHEHPSIQEQELYICPYPSEDFVGWSSISLPNSLVRRSTRYQAGRPATPGWAPRHCAKLNRLKGYAMPTIASSQRQQNRAAHPKSNEKEFKLSEMWLHHCVPSFIEELEDPEWDDPAREIFEDILIAVGPSPEARAVVLSASLNA